MSRYIDMEKLLLDIQHGIKFGQLTIVELIKQQPTADVRENARGEWLDDGVYAEGHSEHTYRCSICKKQFIGYIDEYNFCPNCGADMRGEQDG